MRSHQRIAAVVRAVTVTTTMLCATGVHAFAQGSVTGHVTVLETGRAKKDVNSAVVWLVPVNTVDSRFDTVPHKTSIAMRSREFLPHVRVVAAGGSVEFPNQDPFSHNVFSNSELGRFDLGLYRRRETRVANVTKAGVYAVYCNIHSRMVSFIIAVPSRHVTSVDKTGEFVLRDVPPGVYELHAWHERATETETRITVSSAGAVSEVTLDARGFVPGPHLNKFGQPYSITRADRY